MTRLALGCAWLAAALAGCASAPPGVEGVVFEPVGDLSAVEQRRRNLDRLYTLSDWLAEGRIALRAGDDGWSGSMRWLQQGERLDFGYRAPLGAGSFRISGDPRLLDIELSSGESFQVLDPVSDLTRLFGWSVPVHSLRHWMLGLPDPRSEFSELLDDDGNPAEITQRGWTAKFSRFRAVEGMRLPGRVVMEGDGIRIRLVIDGWSLDDLPGEAQANAAGT